ncbi:DNA/RNA helicase domain-containing protein [Candidatus Nitrospira allomarina]|uniref:DUF2075 domain-containing protein n=1 Tax=Candidatus Nitrospira allomarina TaxID=3020900 RepID=A0AA96G8F7_9BACT|nr:DNA/RNA helicase domain-containing protein [Candidatus Nitrospira allomarina]WNM57324.1 DUF2075 domain-containing protein [Candidatus Nitrospira allomarina]
MRLYSSTSVDFVSDANRNQIAEKLRRSFFESYRYNPSENEVRSWKNSLRAMSGVVTTAGLKDNGIMIEYQLPLTSKRLDFIITGQDQTGRENAAIVELKQWEKTKHNAGETLLTFIGGGERPVLHPSVQVGHYKMYLGDTHTAFHQEANPVHLSACSYLHNYQEIEEDPLFNSSFDTWLDQYPVFTMSKTDRLCEYLYAHTGKGKGDTILKKIESGNYKPSKKLMEHVAGVIEGEPSYVLLDEQLIVFERVLARSRRMEEQGKGVLIIKGGPGTGKSVIAINLMARLLRESRNVHYTTGSRAFTETLRKVIGRRGSTQFKYFNSYMGEEEELIDIMIADESHRIRTTSNSRFTPKGKRSNTSQIDELLSVSRLCVFFIDDAQIVRPNEIGSVDHIKRASEAQGIPYEEYQLEAQFRCGGSDGFLNWVDNTLEIRRTANIIWEGAEGFQFKIFDSPKALEDAIREKASKGNSARVVAGFCWKWSPARKDGTLEEDVVIGDFKRPWDAKPGAKKLAKGIPPAELWAYDPGGLDQVGCVYTAQGFEFDYVGVIFGRDLVYRFDDGGWKGDRKESADSVVKRSKESFVDLVKNTYRVLLSRGIKGCYVHFMDKETERFFKSRMDLQSTLEKAVTTDDWMPTIIEQPGEKAYREYLPLLALEAAAGYFGKESDTSPVGWVKVSGRKLNVRMFVAKVVGDSMAPKILDGTYCLFEYGPEGTRNGQIVLAEHKGFHEIDTNSSYSIKYYFSEKQVLEDSWTHRRIVLKPANKNYQEIEIPEERADEFRIVALYRGTINLDSVDT